MSALYDDPQWPRASAWLAGRLVGAKPAARVAVIGAPVHLGSITRGRCDLAPVAIRKALERYSPYDVSRNRDLSGVAVTDLGDLDVAALRPEDAAAAIRAGVAGAIAEAAAALIFGGDNSITHPGVQAIDGCGLITFDAHFDLRDTTRGLTNGSPVRALLRDGMPGARIVQIGIQSYANSKAYADVARDAGITFFTAEHVRARGIEEVLREAFQVLADLPLYVDLDADVMDRAFAPATPGSRPGGLNPAEIGLAVRMCGANPRVRAMDIVEIDPEKDINDVTSLAAAAFVLEFASGMLER